MFIEVTTCAPEGVEELEDAPSAHRLMVPLMTVVQIEQDPASEHAIVTVKYGSVRLYSVLRYNKLLSKLT